MKKDFGWFRAVGASVAYVLTFETCNGRIVEKLCCDLTFNKTFLCYNMLDLFKKQ